MIESVPNAWLNRWGTCAEFYERFRPGPPPSYYEVLSSVGCAFRGKRVIDLGTGPGLVACELAIRGAHVTGVDLSEEQIVEARRRAKRTGANVSFLIGRVEDLPDFAVPMDLAIANMCWGYFDQPRLLEWLLRNLGESGLLAVSRFNAVYSHPMVELATKTLRTFGVERGRRAEPGPCSHERFVSDSRFRLRALVYYEEPIEFSIDAWVGRWRASMAVVRDMQVADVDALADRLRKQLRGSVEEPFAVEHFINLEIYQPMRAALRADRNDPPLR